MKKGFTLLEVLIVVLVVGILAAMAYPSYKDYVARARRSDGESALLNLAGRLERYYSERNTYQGATIAAGAATDVLSQATSPEGWYTLSINAATATGYTLQATPTGAQGTADTRCQSLTLNNLGAKGITNGPAGVPTSTAADCWR